MLKYVFHTNFKVSEDCADITEHLFQKNKNKKKTEKKEYVNPWLLVFHINLP